MMAAPQYVPKMTRKELDSIMAEKQLFTKAEGWREMAKYSQIGREIEKMKERLLLQDLLKRRKR